MISRRVAQRTVLIVATPFLILAGYGFLSGMVDAALQSGGVPRFFQPAAEFYCVPSATLFRVPVLGELFKASNFFG
jgi:hypothetical protein